LINENKFDEIITNWHLESQKVWERNNVRLIYENGGRLLADHRH